MTEAQIWRGLSKLVDTDNWIEISQSKAKDKLSLSVLREIVSVWFKSLVELMSNLKNSEDKSKDEASDRDNLP